MTNRWNELSKPCFLFLNCNERELRISYVNNKEKNESLFSTQKHDYTKTDIENIVNYLNLKKITFPSNKVLTSSEFTPKSKGKYIDRIMDYKDDVGNLNIFLLKRDAVLQYYQNLKHMDLLVLAKIENGEKLKLYKHNFKIGEKEGIFIPMFTCKDEYLLFEKKNNDCMDELKEYSLLMFKIHEAKKHLCNQEGIFLNPCSAGVCGKDVSFAMSKTFLNKYH